MNTDVQGADTYLHDGGAVSQYGLGTRTIPTSGRRASATGGLMTDGVRTTAVLRRSSTATHDDDGRDRCEGYRNGRK